MSARRTPIEERFWAKVDRSGDCWSWTGSQRGGHGRVRYGSLWDGRPGRPKATYAHRLSYEMAFGPIPDGMTVDHVCFNTLCVRPEHLRLLTPRENAMNKRWHTHCPRGHEFTPENTFVAPARVADGRPNRSCRICRRAVMQRLRDQKKLAAA